MPAGSRTCSRTCRSRILRDLAAEQAKVHLVRVIVRVYRVPPCVGQGLRIEWPTSQRSRKSNGGSMSWGSGMKTPWLGWPRAFRRTISNMHTFWHRPTMNRIGRMRPMRPMRQMHMQKMRFLEGQPQVGLQRLLMKWGQLHTPAPDPSKRIRRTEDGASLVSLRLWQILMMRSLHLHHLHEIARTGRKALVFRSSNFRLRDSVLLDMRFWSPGRGWDHSGRSTSGKCRTAKTNQSPWEDGNRSQF